MAAHSPASSSSSFGELNMQAASEPGSPIEIREDDAAPVGDGRDRIASVDAWAGVRKLFDQKFKRLAELGKGLPRGGQAEEKRELDCDIREAKKAIYAAFPEP